LQTRWRRKGTGAPPHARHRQPTASITGTPPGPTGNDPGVECSLIVKLPAGYAYSDTSLPCAEFFNLDASAQDSQQNSDINPDTLTDDRTSTG